MLFEGQIGKIEVELVDDGTLDTVLLVTEYAPNGFHIIREGFERILQKAAIDYRSKNGSFTDENFKQMIEDLLL